MLLLVSSYLTSLTIVKYSDLIWPQWRLTALELSWGHHSSCVPYFSLYIMSPLQAIIPVLNKKVIHRGSWSGGKKCEHGSCSWFESQEKRSSEGSTWRNLSKKNFEIGNKLGVSIATVSRIKIKLKKVKICPLNLMEIVIISVHQLQGKTENCLQCSKMTVHHHPIC